MSQMFLAVKAKIEELAEQETALPSGAALSWEDTNTERDTYLLKVTHAGRSFTLASFTSEDLEDLPTNLTDTLIGGWGWPIVRERLKDGTDRGGGG